MRLTKRGNKVFVGTQGLHAAFVLVVPDPNGLVISTAYYESSSRVKQYPAHPVVMSHLQTQDRLATTLLTMQRHWAATLGLTLPLLTRVMRQIPMLTSHILIVLSLEPESRKGPGFPLFLFYHKDRDRTRP